MGQGHGPLLPREVFVHDGGADHCLTTADGAEGHPLAADAHCHPVGCPLPQPHRVHHEHPSAVDREASLETENAVKGRNLNPSESFSRCLHLNCGCYWTPQWSCVSLFWSTFKASQKHKGYMCPAR